MNSDSTRLTGTGGADPTAATQLPATPPGPATTVAGPDLPPMAPPSDPTTLAGSGEPPPLHGIAPGTLLVNTYRVERLLGGGGMGEVYLARHAKLGTLHAVKVIRPAMVANRQVMDLFFREAKVLRGVRHDAVVSYDGFVQDADGRDYLVMEFVEGHSLAERLRQGPLPAEEVLTLRDRLAAGLAEAHRRGAIHRDISPDNVILTGDQVATAKLIDFGLSKLTDPTQESIIGDSFAGKFRFASPEQFGMFGGQIDGRSDIYSLGLILAAAALGRPLDMGNSFDAAYRSRQSVPDLTRIPKPLQPWLTAMLEPDPARRPLSLDDLLQRWPALTQAGGPPRAAPGRQPGQPASRGRSGLLLWGGGAVLAAAAAGGLIFVLRPLPPVPPGPQGGHTEAPPPTAGDPRPRPPDTQTGDIAALTKAGRYDEALRSAQALIAAPPASGLPTGALLPLAKQLQTAGRSADAFALAEALIGAGAPPPTADLWSLAQDLRAAGRLDPYFFLVRTLANQDDGPAAFALAELYDPLHWTAATSPLPKPRADKAQEWYRKAQALGVPAAAARLEALKTAPGG
ncbi:protein kinase [uncultured Thiodictyon sp.]|uniref:serine/threonine-protein kinase n=1 Tax=uncultured Thiodictyon sp. TaxID=1846217 RepID=UPI0025F78EB4|nr:protein kinase [uncultured Thiodictyon sp.]